MPEQPSERAAVDVDREEELIALLSQAYDLARDGHLGLLDVIDRGLPVNLTNQNGDTLLILATYHQHTELVTGLLERGADTERVNERGQTALACAVFRQNEDLVDLLLRTGADPRTGGPSALATAQFFGLESLARRLEGATGIRSDGTPQTDPPA